MADVEASIQYLQKLPLYNEEKPYYALLAPSPGFDPDKQRLDNLEFELRSNIHVTDIRPDIDKYTLEKNGFQVISHTSRVLEVNDLHIPSPEQADAYRKETEELLKETFNAEYVLCYDFRKRVNVPHPRNQFDYNDPMLIEGPAVGAHSDVTFDSGPVIINRYLSDDVRMRYLREGYRIRILNTWRSLVDGLEDRPLALCDNKSVDPGDLVAADRILPDRIGEVYYLTWNPEHRWHYLECQKPSELWGFIMYDTKEGNHAKFCPHVSFDNPRKSPDAAVRRSVETRSIIITRL